MALQNSNSAILDADFLIALYLVEDSNNSKALEIFQKLDGCKVLNITFYEVATVLSRLLPQNLAITILRQARADFMDVVLFDSASENASFEIFEQQTNKNISFYDCAVLNFATKNGYKIASFDRFYPRELLIDT